MNKVPLPTQIQEGYSIYDRRSLEQNCLRATRAFIEAKHPVNILNWHIVKDNYATEQEYQDALKEYKKIKNYYNYIYDWINLHYHFAYGEMGVIENIQGRLTKLSEEINTL